MATLPLVDGLRGAVLLEAGDYEVSDPGLTIYDSGIVIRGQGQGATGGTRIIFTSTVKESYAITLGFTNGGLENIECGLQEIETCTITYPVVDAYVPTGSKTITISNASSMTVGDRIIIKLQPNDDWLLHSKYEGWLLSMLLTIEFY